MNTSSRIKEVVAVEKSTKMVTMRESSTSSSAVPNIADIEVVKSTSTSTSTSVNTKNTDLLSSIGGPSDANAATCVQSNDSITITASAVRQIQQIAKRKRPDSPSDLYLRLYVDAGGCSGFEYKFEVEFKDDAETEIDLEEDVVIQASIDDGSAGVEVVVDESSLEYIKGSTVDFVNEMVRSTFVVVDNPHSESACGCGSSFAVKNFAGST